MAFVFAFGILFLLMVYVIWFQRVPTRREHEEAKARAQWDRERRRKRFPKFWERP